jgi:hypothetical protein
LCAEALWKRFHFTPVRLRDKRAPVLTAQEVS